MTASSQFPERPEQSRLKRLLHFVGLDSAIAYTILARGTTIAGSVITVLLIARFLTPVQQGFYYMLWSMVALQVVFELGFTFVILQMAAHERAHLTFSKEHGFQGEQRTLERLASVLKKALRWYFYAAVLMLFTLLPAGIYFFRKHAVAGIPEIWYWPWIATLVASTFTFQMDAVYAFLEGCGEVSQVAKMRLAQSSVGMIMSWSAMILRHGLFAPSMVMIGHILIGTVFLARRKSVLLPLLRLDTGSYGVSWMKEVWPFQWRIAVSWLCTYFTSSVFTPIVFATRGPVEAGRMGMSMNICSSLGALAIAWMNTKAAPFGALIARNERKTLDTLFYRTLWQSTSILAAGAVSVLAGLFALRYFAPALASRMLAPSVFSVLLLGFLATHVVQSLAIYLRSHKAEPFLLQSILVALAVCGSAYFLGRTWGAQGVAFGFAFSVGILGLASAIMIFRRKVGLLTQQEAQR